MVVYSAYIKSPQWLAKKRYFLARAPWCWCCTTPYHWPKVFDLHHVTYQRLGHEHPFDLRLVCRACHKFIHLIEPLHPNITLLEITELARFLKRTGQYEISQQAA